MDRFKVAAASVRNLIGRPDASIADMCKWAELAAHSGAELILFPELNLSGYIPASIASEVAETVPGPSTEKVIRLAQDYHVAIAFGIIERKQDNLYCTHVLVNERGVVGKQRKIHVPVQEQPFWSAGDCIDVFDIGKVKVGIAICRDSFFGA